MIPKNRPLSSVLIKPAGPDCNMACTYCFYLEKAELFPDTKRHRMSEDILKETIRQVLTCGGSQVSFGWQGGEPTLMGLPFFEKAVELQQRYGHGQTVGNGLQTNGILIDQAWLEFLLQYQFLVGLSLDGPEHIHNKYRRMRGGQPSFEKVAAAGRRMLEAGVAVNALTVINDYSVGFPEEIYAFHKDMGFQYIQFIPCLESHSGDRDKIAPFVAPPEEYGRFLCRVFDLWLQDFDGPVATTSIRFFDSVFHTYVDLPPPECTLLKECGVYVVVEHNGDIYSCDFFVDPEWRLGNVLEGRLVDMLNSARQAQFGRQKSDLPEACRRCRWLGRCRGGCPKDRLNNPDNRSLDYFCESYKSFFEYADPTLTKLAADWKTQQALPPPSPPPPAAKPGRNDPCPCGSGLKFKKCCGG
jgi:uncharacterized protein